MSRSRTSSHLRRSERLESRSKSKAKLRRERVRSRGKRSGRRKVSTDFEGEGGSGDSWEDLNTPYKRPKPTPFTTRITRFKYHEKAKLLRNVKVYEGIKDLKDHLGIFSADVEPEEWPFPKFLEEFSQQKRYAKDHMEIHSIKRRMNEGLQAFMDRFKSESSHIKGVLPVLRILAFMHGHGHPELAKKPAPRNETKKSPIPGGPEVKRETGGEAVQRSSEGIWEHVPLTQGATRSRPLLKHQWRFWLWKRQGTQYERLLSFEEANRRGYGIGKTGPLGAGYTPRQPEKQNSKMRRHESHKHGGFRRNPLMTI
ncbi:hypothetical protein Tco_0971032 [Tanacetum coccineum]